MQLTVALNQKGNSSDRSDGAGIAQWLERRTHDRKVSGSSHRKSGGRTFFSRVNFLCRHHSAKEKKKRRKEKRKKEKKVQYYINFFGLVVSSLLKNVGRIL